MQLQKLFSARALRLLSAGGIRKKHSLCWSLPKRLVKKHFPSAATSLLRDRSIPFWSRWNNRWEGVDILVNSAGINRLMPAEEYSDEDFSYVLDVNLKALHTLTRETGRRFMIPRRYGRILNLSSVKSLIGTSADYIAYCASKGAVNMYTKQLACEWGKYQITCNAIAPTFVRTPINSFQLDDPVFYESLTRRIPLGRIGKESDIAAAALFLCSDASSFITGQILCVDGGLTAMQ